MPILGGPIKEISSQVATFSEVSSSFHLQFCLINFSKISNQNINQSTTLYCWPKY